MDFKGIRSVSVSCLLLHILRQINDLNRSKWAFLNADTTTDAKLFRNSRDLVSGFNFDAEFAHAHDWTKLHALLCTFFGLTFLVIHNGDTCQLLIWLILSFLPGHRLILLLFLYKTRQDPHVVTMIKKEDTPAAVCLQLSQK